MIDEIDNLALNLMREKIIQDLQPKYLLDDLVSSGLLSKVQKETILTEQDEEQQARLLLDIVEKGGRKSLDGFLTVLRTDEQYIWLADDFEDSKVESRRVSDTFKTWLAKGGVPQVSSHMLLRGHLHRTVKMYLNNILKLDSGWVAIHGMAGSGKTMLLASALRDMLDFAVKNEWKGGIYWVKIGKDISSDNLLSKMHTLCEKLDVAYRGNVPLTVDMAADRLRTIFADKLAQKPLLVLDDVWSDSVIRHFDFDCHFVVTTRDKSIMEVVPGYVSFVELSTGFDLKETKAFLASTLDVTISDLPSCVSDICAETQGCPMVINIISYFVKKQPESARSKAFLACLTKLRDNSLISWDQKSPYDYPCIHQALKMSVDSLDRQEYFYDLAIFSQDIYIPGAVLCILWNVDEWEVKEIMNSFVDKSIAIKIPNGNLFDFYAIHDLYHSYLINTQVESLPDRHARLLDNYLCKYNMRFEDLPNDNYILTYLGHHLSGAKRTKTFPNVFLNLRIVISKLEANGPADMLGDYLRYKKEITCEEDENLEKYKAFHDFVSTNAHLLSGDYDILQIALCQPSSSSVYQQAREICRASQDNKYYYEWHNRDKQKQSKVLSTIPSTSSVNCARFLFDGKYIACGTSNGKLKILSADSGRVLLRLSEHKCKINWLSSYFDKKAEKEVIVSCSDDRTVRVRPISLQSLNTVKKVKRLDSNDCVVFKNHEAKVGHCCILKDGQIAASMDLGGIVKVWIVATGKELSSWAAHAEFDDDCCCEFSPKGLWLLTAAGSEISLWDFGKQLPKWEYRDPLRAHFTSCCFSPDGRSILATINHKVVEFKARDGSRKFHLDEPSRKFFLHCCVSPDNHYVAASTTEQSVIVWRKQDRRVIDQFYGHKGAVHSVMFSPHGANNVSPDGCKNILDRPCFRLVSAAYDGTVMIWETTIDCLESDGNLRDVFSVQFNVKDKPMVAVVDVNNRIQVQNECQKESAIENVSTKPSFVIRCCALSHNCDKVIYGAEDGTCSKIMLFDILSKTTTAILAAEDGAIPVCCVFSRDDHKVVFAYANGDVRILHSNKIVNKSGAHNGPVVQVRFYSSEASFVTCSKDNTLKVFSIVNGEDVLHLVGHEDSVLDCDVSPSDCHIVSASADKTLKIWDAVSGTLLTTLSKHDSCVRVCRFAPQKNFLASGDDSNRLLIWDISAIESANETSECSLTPLAETSPPKSHVSNSWINDLVFSADGMKFVVCSDMIAWYMISQTKANHSDGDSDAYRITTLQKFPIRGSRASRIYCSDDFKSFVTVDDIGVLYYLTEMHYNRKKNDKNHINNGLGLRC